MGSPPVTGFEPTIEGGAVPLPRHGSEQIEPAPAPVSEAPPVPPLPGGTLPRLPEYECGSCGTVFGTNFKTEEIECPECEARRCPHCETWFGAQE